MLSGRILPIHFPPSPDELLSSWYVRLAHANRLKAETFNTVLWGRERQIWNRDIDRLSPERLIRDLAERTGTPVDAAQGTALKSYEGRIFAELRSTGVSPWLIPVQMYHRKHKWPGIQYCPECLKEDEEPYFRKRWRLALYTACPRHGVLVCNRCPNCDEPVMFHRRELGKSASLDMRPLSLCYNCDYDLRLAAAPKPLPYERSAAALSADATGWLEQAGPAAKEVGFYTALHQICKLLDSETWGRKLRTFATDRLGLDGSIHPEGEISPIKRAFFEHRPIAERHRILHIAYWLLADPAARLGEPLLSKSFRFNRLYRDLHFMPAWYRDTIAELPHRAISALKHGTRR